MAQTGVMIHWCSVHNKSIPEWTNTCWDYNPMQKPYCIKVKARVEVLPE